MEIFASSQGSQKYKTTISHVVVEVLLQLLVDKVDGDLLKAVVFKDLEPGDVEDGAEVRFLQGGVCGKIRL